MRRAASKGTRARTKYIFDNVFYITWGYGRGIGVTAFLFAMATITALTVQKRNPDRVNVHLDGRFAFGLPADAAGGLTVGQFLSDPEIAALQREDEFDYAKQTAVRLISYRPRSVAEVTRHLQKKGYDDDIITRVVERLETVKLLDDATFVDYWVEQRETFKPRSHLALRQELRRKGVSRKLIDARLADVDETEAARRAAAKRAVRWSHLPEEEFRARLGRFLQRRGFNYEIIRDITDETWQQFSSD